MAAGIPNGQFAIWLRHLKGDVGIPEGYASWGVTEDMVEELVAVAMKDPCHQVTLVPSRKRTFVICSSWP